MHPARSPVPRLDGQVRIQPRCSECMKSCPSFLRTSWIFWVESANRVMIRLMLSPELCLTYTVYFFFSFKTFLLTFLHWDDAHLILLVDPDKKILLIVVKDSYKKFSHQCWKHPKKPVFRSLFIFNFLTSSVGPVTTTSRREKEGRIGLLEEVSGLSELLLLFKRHALGLSSVGFWAMKREIISLQFALEGQKALGHQSFELTALLEVSDWKLNVLLKI